MIGQTTATTAVLPKWNHSRTTDNTWCRLRSVCTLRVVDHTPWHLDPIHTVRDIAAGRPELPPVVPDQIARFLAERVVRGDGLIRGAEIYRRFETFAAEQGWDDVFRASMCMLGRSLKREFRYRRDRHGVIYLGLAVVE